MQDYSRQRQPKEGTDHETFRSPIRSISAADSPDFRSVRRRKTPARNLSRHADFQAGAPRRLPASEDERPEGQSRPHPRPRRIARRPVYNGSACSGGKFFPRRSRRTRYLAQTERRACSEVCELLEPASRESPSVSAPLAGAGAHRGDLALHGEPADREIRARLRRSRHDARPLVLDGTDLSELAERRRQEALCRPQHASVRPDSEPPARPLPRPLLRGGNRADGGEVPRVRSGIRIRRSAETPEVAAEQLDRRSERSSAAFRKVFQ